MSQIAKQVESVLRQDERARNSDNVLIVHMLQLHGAKLTAEQIQVLCDFNFESVTRCRRKIQEEGRYLPSPAVAHQRGLKAKTIAANVAAADASTTQTLVARGRRPTTAELKAHINPSAPPEVQESLLDLLKWSNDPKYNKPLN